jgi:hypothetical protein
MMLNNNPDKECKRENAFGLNGSGRSREGSSGNAMAFEMAARVCVLTA